METLYRKEQILKAFKEGKTVQSKNGNEWKDFIRQNQLDTPNLDYGGIDNWRIKPEPIKSDDTVIDEIENEAVRRYKGKDLSEQKENTPLMLAFEEGAKWYRDRQLQSDQTLIEKLEAEKKELVEMLVRSQYLINSIKEDCKDSDLNEYYDICEKISDESKSLIQKHKQ